MKKKIAILGCENSHADGFLGLIRDGQYPDLEVVGLYSREKEAAERLSNEFGIPVMENYEDLVGQIDCLIITARHGKDHYLFAKPYMPSGIPMFIDKPITIDPEEALQLIADARKYGVKLCGGSVLAHVEGTHELAEMAANGACGRILGGTVVAPGNLVNEYGGYYFYAQHLVQMMTTIFGDQVRSVSARRYDNCVAMLVHYDNYTVAAHYTDRYYYAASIYGENGIVSREMIVDGYKPEMDAIDALIHGGDMTQTYEEFIQPVFIMNAIEEAMRTGQTVEVRKYE